jgi:uncharacterized membrane protein
MNIAIDKNAPVHYRDSIKIAATKETIWAVLTDIDQWPNWQKSVAQSKLLGDLEEGTSFKWKAGGLFINSKIHTVNPYNMFGWTGSTIGASAIHNWKFETENGATIVYVEESLNGIFPHLFRHYFQKSLEKGMVENLNDLKTAAESK